MSLLSAWSISLDSNFKLILCKGVRLCPTEMLKIFWENFVHSELKGNISPDKNGMKEVSLDKLHNHKRYIIGGELYKHPSSLWSIYAHGPQKIIE